MRAFYLISIFLCLFTCSAPIDGDISVEVLRIEKRFFQEQYHRTLVTIDANSNQIDEQQLYWDISGCYCYLFDDSDTYTLIDCNGEWYSIQKKSGEIAHLFWGWDKDLPSNYLGTYKANYTEKDKCVFIKEEYPTKEEVYFMKDPQ